MPRQDTVQLRSCGDCMHWRSPDAESTDPRKPAYGVCRMLMVHPRIRRVMPEHEIEPQERWQAERFRTTATFNACRGWAPADRTTTWPELQQIAGGKTA